MKTFYQEFLYYKKMDIFNFWNFEQGSRPISDIFYLSWEVFLSDFLSKMKSQEAWKGFGVISK